MSPRRCMEYAIGTNSCRPFSDWLSVNSVSVFSPTASSSLITPDESREELNHHRINPAGGLDLWKKLIARIPAPAMILSRPPAAALPFCPHLRFDMTASHALTINCKSGIVLSEKVRLQSLFKASVTDHFPSEVKAIRTAGSTADWRPAALLIELKAQIL